MGGLLELLLLVGAIVLAVSAGRGLMGESLRERRERAHLDRLAGRPAEEAPVSEPGVVERTLRAAGFTGPIELAMFGATVFAAILGFIALTLLPRIPGLAIVAFAFGFYLPWVIAKEWARVRSRRFERKLIESVDLMAGALYAGSNLSQAFRSAGQSSDEPVRGEFLEAERRLSVGMPLGRALGRMVESYDGEGVRLFVQTAVAKNQAGGDLAPLLKSLNETLRDRYRHQRQLDAHLAGARVSAMALALLPYLIVPVLLWLRPDWLRALQLHPLGSTLLAFAVLLQLIGLLWVWNIVNREA